MIFTRTRYWFLNSRNLLPRIYLVSIWKSYPISLLETTFPANLRTSKLNRILPTSFMPSGCEAFSKKKSIPEPQRLTASRMPCRKIHAFSATTSLVTHPPAMLIRHIVIQDIYQTSRRPKSISNAKWHSCSLPVEKRFTKKLGSWRSGSGSEWNTLGGLWYRCNYII